jgi:hypothetical protein
LKPEQKSCEEPGCPSTSQPALVRFSVELFLA